MSTKKPRPATVSEPIPATIQASAFKATCLELMDELASRQAEIVVTKHGRPVVKVGPVNTRAPSPVGFLRGTVVAHTDIVSPMPQVWKASPSDPLNNNEQ